MTVVGICGPSGCGKSSLAKGLTAAFPKSTIIGEGSYHTFPCPPSYEHRDPRTETPLNVNWDMLVSDIEAALQNAASSDELVFIDHYLLLSAPERVIEAKLDLLLFLSADVDTCLRRRIDRNSERSEEEKQHLGHYYRRAVWPAYRAHTWVEVGRVKREASLKVVEIDSGALSAAQVFEAALNSIQQKLRSGNGGSAPSAK